MSFTENNQNNQDAATQPPAQCPFAGQSHYSVTKRTPQVHPQLDLTESFEATKEILKSASAVQMGFSAEQVQGVQGSEHPPVLYMEGEQHTEMRRATAKYFTPTQVASYHQMIADYADELMAELHQKKELNLDDLSLKLAVGVASHVVGITDSILPGMPKRVETLVSSAGDGEPFSERTSVWNERLQQFAVAQFFFLDVMPSIRARRKAPKDDLISYLLERNYKDQDILTECVTYGTAGMVTTREFITVAALHLLKDKELRMNYVHGTEKERTAILHEILRLEPVVVMLYRKLTEEAKIAGQVYPAGTIFALNIQEANQDPTIMGDMPDQLCPMRPLPKGVQAQGLAFGDGIHRCPGAFLAIKETDIFLRRLLIWEDLRIVQEPEISYNEIIKGYELRGLRIRLGA